MSDLPDGLPGSISDGRWGIGSSGEPFRMVDGTALNQLTSAQNVLQWDRYGIGIGSSAAEAIWRNGRMHPLSSLVAGLPSNMGSISPRKITPSGLIWIGNDEGLINGLLVPIEVVAPDLDHNDVQSTEYPLLGAASLKVAKMEHSLRQDTGLIIDNDAHRFHVRIPAKIGTAAQVTLETNNFLAADNDNPNILNLSLNSYGMLQTQSMILVSDDIDDDADGTDDREDDRTHKILLGGDVKISSVKIGQTSYPFDMKVPVRIRATAEVRVIFVGAASAYHADFIGFMKIATERFAQAGVHLEFDYKDMPVPPTVLDDRAVQHYDGVGGGGSQGLGNLVHADIKALVDAAAASPTVGRRDFTIFVVRGLLQPNPTEIERGKAVTKRLTAPNDRAYARIAVLSAEDIVKSTPAQTSWFTFAHELGHLLTNNGHYGTTHDREDPDSVVSRGEYGPDVSDPSVARNLMRKGTQADRGINGNKRLLRDQEKMILEEFGGTP